MEDILEYQTDIKLNVSRVEGEWIIDNGMTQGVNADFTKALIDFALTLEDYQASLSAGPIDTLGERLLKHQEQLWPLFNPPRILVAREETTP